MASFNPPKVCLPIRNIDSKLQHLFLKAILVVTEGALEEVES